MNRRPLPSLNAVRSFEAAARHLSFTKAAAELRVTQGAVSRMVQTLEAELGAPLFRRIGRRIELTPAGAAYHAKISDALDRIATATRSVHGAGDTGLLSISVLPTFALRWLVPRLPAFQQRHPDFLVDVTAGEHTVDFSSEPIDIALRYGLGRWPNAEATLVMRERMGVFCAPSLLQRSALLRGPHDLPAHRLLQHTTRAEAWPEFFAQFGLPAPDLTRASGFEHFFMIVEAAAAGMGVALLPLFLARAETAAGRLVQPFPQTLQRKQAYYLLHARGTGRVRRIRLFKEWLVSEAKSG